MDLLLIHPNDQKAIYGDTLQYVACEPPFWMAVAGQYCLDKNIDVALIDAEAENMSLEDLERRIKQDEPGVVGIFVTGTNLSASTQKTQASDLTCSMIKLINPKIPVFLWGLHPSALPERTLKEDEADYVVKGEGFETIVNLARFHRGDDIKFAYENFHGLYYWDNSEIKSFGEGVLLQTGDIPLPAWNMLPMEKYMPHNWHIMGEDNPKDAKGRYAVISTSIGCPYNCSFCAISSLFGTKKLRFWDTDRIIMEIERLVIEYNTKYIKILDKCFVLKKDYVNELCDKLIEKNFDVNMWAYARVDTVDPDILHKLQQAGIRWLAYGIESADDEVLSGVSKSQYNTEMTMTAMKWTKDAGINIIANFMFGLPNDTKESMKRTFELSRSICPEWINFYVTMPYPGSKDYFDAVKNGKIKEDAWIQYAQYSYECMPMGGYHLTPREVLEFRDNAFNEFFKDNDRYFDMIQEKFGQQYVDSIKEMTKKKLRRKLLEENG